MKSSNVRLYLDSSLSQSSIVSLSELISDGGNSSESGYVRVVDSRARRESSASFGGEETLSAVEEVIDNFVERTIMTPIENIVEETVPEKEPSPIAAASPGKDAVFHELL